MPANGKVGIGYPMRSGKIYQIGVGIGTQSMTVDTATILMQWYLISTLALVTQWDWALMERLALATRWD